MLKAKVFVVENGTVNATALEKELEERLNDWLTHNPDLVIEHIKQSFAHKNAGNLAEVCLMTIFYEEPE